MIAVDAMGGDHAPREIVLGAIAAAQKGVPILLCGIKTTIVPILSSIKPNWAELPIFINDCSQVIGMHEEPMTGVRTKKDASLVQAMRAVASGTAWASVSAGNSGAVVLAGSLIIGRIPGIERPAVGSFLPTKSNGIFCLDLGANTQATAGHLVQFATMGQEYVRLTKKIKAPRVALLSNGHEPYKGTSVLKDVYKQLSKMPCNFVGNLEAKEILHEGADVLVTDGFTGNVLLKSMQGTAELLFEWLGQEARNSKFYALMLYLCKPMFKKIYQRADYASTGGALVLGLKKPVILAHGRASARAIENAILFAKRVHEDKRLVFLNNKMSQHFSTFVAARRVKENLSGVLSQQSQQ